MSRITLALVSAVLSVGIASIASAGDKIWSVPGVINDGVGTAFSCTNGSTAAASVTVALFDSGGTAAGTATAMIPVGGTKNFATKNIAALPGATLVGSLPTLQSGSATITAPSGVYCAAFVTDAAVDPPTVMMALPIIAKTKQKGV